MSLFDKVFENLMELEGYYSNDKDDNGGETKFGISKNSFPEIDIFNLTEEEAKEIYRNNYWLRNHCNDIKDKKIASKVFDIAVNCGSGNAGLFIQRAINEVIKEERIAIKSLSTDGQIGPITIATLNSLNEKKNIMNYLIFELTAYYLKVSKRKNNIKYLRGWLKRASFIYNLG